MSNDVKDGQELFLQQLLGTDPGIFEQILSAAPAGIVIIDKDGQIVFINSEAVKIFGYRAEEVIGQAVEFLMPERFHLDHLKQRKNYIKQPSDRLMGADRNVLGRRKDGTEFPLEIGLSFVQSAGKVLVSAVVIDITSRKKIEADRDALINQLQAALEKVKQLSGLLPICAGCKKIKDDTGFWNQIESYIHNHSEVRFSHGLCPDCAQRLYPECFPP